MAALGAETLGEHLPLHFSQKLCVKIVRVHEENERLRFSLDPLKKSCVLRTGMAVSARAEATKAKNTRAVYISA
jgi:hypothetical protein